MAEDKEKKAGSKGEGSGSVESAPADVAAAAGSGIDALLGPDAGAEKAAGDAATAAVRKSKRNVRMIPAGVAHVRATFNNTVVSIADPAGNVIAWSSSGRAGFKGSRKSTAFAATVVGQEAARLAVARGMHEVEVRVQGAGSGRESAVRALQSSGLNVTVIKDVTPVPHNGCRSRKRRRV